MFMMVSIYNGKGRESKEGTMKAEYAAAMLTLAAVNSREF